MVLNPGLYMALLNRFGSISVSSENVLPQLIQLPNSDPARRGQVKWHATLAGEHYAVDCPFCNDDRKRLSISARWLTSIRGSQPVVNIAQCFNEHCSEIYDRSFWGSIAEEAQANPLPFGIPIDLPRHREGPIVRPTMLPTEFRLPYGMLTLDQLPADHEARLFFEQKYNISADYAAKAYRVGWASQPDPDYRESHGRIIFPVFADDGQVINWQGRATDPDAFRRWYLPPGSTKSVFNLQAIPKGAVVVIAEGPPAAIAAGPRGIGIFGKTLDAQRVEAICEKASAVVIATDAETQLNDPRSKSRSPNAPGPVQANRLLEQFTRRKLPAMLFPYPEEIMNLVRRQRDLWIAQRDAGEKMKSPFVIPDLADMGIKQVGDILRELPPPFRAAYVGA